MNPLTPTLAALLAVTAPLHAQFYADVETSMGTFTIDVDFTNSPLAAGNFIGLANGSKKWIDATTGQVMSDTPYYEGIIFHRVISGFVNQTGSQKGDGSDGPGYTFRDEFSTSDFSVPYRVAMANSGPQSNGSQIFITVNSPIGLNDVHTVFGNIPADDGPGGIVDGSRTIIDNINAVTTTNEKPNTDVTILSISIRRIGTAAENFDESAPALPLVSHHPVTLEFPGLASDPNLSLTQAPGTTFGLGLSADLESWQIEKRYLDSAAPASLNDFITGPLQSTQTRHFYLPSLVTWPNDAIFPDSLANRTFSALLIKVDPVVPFEFVFDATGVTGTWTYPRPGDPLSGNITDSFQAPDGYGCRLIMILSGINYNRWDFRRIGFDSDTPTLLNCRQSGDATSNSPFGPPGSLSLDGTSTLTR